MGYKTTYTLTFEPDTKEITDKVQEHLQGFAGLCLKLRKIGCFATEEGWVWNEDKKEMLELSKKLPDITFHLHGEGDQCDDIWEMHFRNGKSQVCNAEMVIPSFDPEKLE